MRELLRGREKGVLRAAHPRTPFQGEYPPEQEGRKWQILFCTGKKKESLSLKSTDY